MKTIIKDYTNTKCLTKSIRSISFVIGVVVLSACHSHYHDGEKSSNYRNSAQHLTQYRQVNQFERRNENVHIDRMYPDNHRKTELPAFYYYLAEGYTDLAQQEDYEHHFNEQLVFENKAKQIREGIQVDPHQVAERKVPSWSIKELETARADFMLLLRGRAYQQLPYLLAQAQVMFDCWLEEQEENINEYDINICRKAFYSSFNQIKLELDSSQIKYKSPFNKNNFNNRDENLESCYRSKVCPDNNQYQMPTIVKPMSFILYFNLDSDRLTQHSIQMLQKIKKKAQQIKPKQISVKGHTDRAGKQLYNSDLSQRRVQSVINALVLSGIDKSLINSGYYGENQPKIKTQDGMVKAENRRVEIRFE